MMQNSCAPAKILRLPLLYNGEGSELRYIEATQGVQEWRREKSSSGLRALIQHTVNLFLLSIFPSAAFVLGFFFNFQFQNQKAYGRWGFLPSQ